jgi:hypothetical protein
MLRIGEGGEELRLVDEDRTLRDRRCVRRSSVVKLQPRLPGQLLMWTC